MIVAQISNREIVQVGDPSAIFPNISFGPNGPDKKFLDENNCRVVQYSKQYNNLTQKLVPCPPYYESGNVYAVKVVSMTSDEIQKDKETAMVDLKYKRNALLLQSDFSQLPDATVDKKQWAIYRDSLRKFPATVSDARLPYTFPEAPKE